ncbi:homeodomain-leucine zipper transcription factor-like protein [Oryza sativa Japonica Group]|uniref:Homeodomain-leucine zipper transcription factor-like protein n=1 Tax=Oryza sativa subsp. japonica TaxID=39947 RepID=Q5VQX6_ORYSJ|nr:homeodomain-leucine zipper transcription factor-like protein [Oryza sativa Japonica Group]
MSCSAPDSRNRALVDQHPHPTRRHWPSASVTDSSGGSAGRGADEPPSRRGTAPQPQQLCGWNSGGGPFSSSFSPGRGRTAMMVCHDVEMPFLRGINVNRPAPAAETTTVRGATVARRKRSPARPPPTARSPAGSDDENCGGGGGSRVPRLGQGWEQQQ